MTDHTGMLHLTSHETF